MSTNDSAGLPPAGWYPDPQGSGRRWWDGTAWTDQFDPHPAAPAGAGQDIPGYTTPGQGGAGVGGDGYPGGYEPIGVWHSPVDDRPPVYGMGGAIGAVFGRYAQFLGRAGRPEFWFWWLFEALVSIGILVLLLALNVAAFVGGSRGAFAALITLGILAVLWWLAVILPTLAVTVRRLRDGGFHWALVFLQLVPGGGIVILILCALPSKYA
jgi:uncharacterized membrane protein YhaH (DUF805 family)